ncbi:MAG: hypothetical protein Q7S57_02570 [bacterium]|nr:hypothetical protein [bacterium]
MGLALPALKYLVEEYRRKPFPGPILTLGRQCIYATEGEIRQLLIEMEVVLREPPIGIQRNTNITAWKNIPYAKYASDQLFFGLLTGQNVETLDISNYEDAEYVWDLNQPVPAEWRGKFGTVIDAGTSEHIFDVRQNLQNVNILLKNGGRLFHLSPANNYMEHGYYQFSPVVFHDYYGVNGFVDMRCILVEQRPWALMRGHWQKWDWSTKRPATNIISHQMLEVFFTAEKVSNSTVDKTPQQGFSYEISDFSRTRAGHLGGLKAKLYYFLPQSLVILAKRLLGFDKSVKPWGLRFRGKL